MLFNSFDFLIFFPIVVLIYYFIPKKVSYLWLLVASYYFYMCSSPAYVLLLLFSSVVTYLCGIFIERSKAKQSEGKRRGKFWLALSFIITLTNLFFFKYANFVVTDLVAGITALYPNLQLKEPTFSIALPVGISFFTFQELGYIVDVYRNEVKAEKNLFRYCVFVSFFPQLLSGPIGRATELLGQFYEKHNFEFERVKNGLLRMLWGYFVKLVIADRAAILVNQVFDHYQSYSGFQLLVAALLFGIQIYCDFAGYSEIAIGAAEVMGFRLMENFHTPYFSRSVSEFWRRWHISLSSWFRDYLYIPLGGSRCDKRKKYRNLMIVFLVSGLWHGAGWTFLVWGGLNGLYQVIGAELKPVKKWFYQYFSVKEESFSHKLMQMIFTFLLIDFAWIFFRANTMRDACGFIGRMFTTLDIGTLFNGALLQMKLDGTELVILLCAMVVLGLISILHYRKIRIREVLAQQGIWFRYILYFGLLFTVLIFGVYGSNYDASQFIYFQF